MPDPVVILSSCAPRDPRAWRMTVHPRAEAVRATSMRDPVVASLLAQGPESGGMQVLFFLADDTPIVEVPAPPIG
jgi:hypothetical protein